MPVSVYCASSRWDVRGFSILILSVALGNASHDIRVNCICPSHIDTPLVQKLAPTEPSLTSLIPKGRVGLPEEIVDLVMFLCNPRSNWINGTAITIDGAMTAGHNFRPAKNATEEKW